jgi:hypothetical protein
VAIRAIQMYAFVRFAQRSVGMIADARIRRPPIVGVPALARCVWGPSCRMTCSIWKSRSRRITVGPITRLIASAVIVAPAVLNVMYWNTLKIGIGQCVWSWP